MNKCYLIFNVFVAQVIISNPIHIMESFLLFLLPTHIFSRLIPSSSLYEMLDRFEDGIKREIRNIFCGMIYEFA